MRALVRASAGLLVRDLSLRQVPVTGKRFFAHHGLETDKARSFTAEKIEDSLVGFRLKDEPAAAKDEGKKTRRPAAEAADLPPRISTPQRSCGDLPDGRDPLTPRADSIS